MGSIITHFILGLATAAFGLSLSSIAGAQAAAPTKPHVSPWGTCVLSAGVPVCWGFARELLPEGVHSTTRPVRLTGVTGLSSVGMGDAHACGIDTSGTVKCWGSRYGAEGDIAYGFKTPEGLPKSSQVVVGQYHRCVVSNAGEVWCWGDNSYGAVNGKNTDRTRTPVKVENLQNVAEVALGQVMTCARTKAGGVECWGRLYYADNPPVSKLTKRAVKFPASARIDAENDLVCSLSTQGKVHCYGGDACSFSKSETCDESTVVEVDLPGKARDIAVGGGNLCVLTEAGRIFCAGYMGGLILHKEDETTLFGEVGGISGAVSVNVGSQSGCAGFKDGSVACWGERRRLGVDYPDEVISPVGVVGLANIRAIRSGEEKTCALSATGEVFCWGNRAESAQPEKVDGLSGMSDLTVSGDMVCAAGSGKVWCTGGRYIDASLLGAATNTPPKTMKAPVQIPTTASMGRPALGSTHACAVSDAQKLVCWGRNYNGALGTPQSKEYPEPEGPKEVSGVSQVGKVAAARRRTCILDLSGQVSCFGDGTKGLLGNGKVESASTPQKVLNLSGVVDLTLSSEFACTLSGDKSVSCWGNGALTPVPWVGLGNLIHVATGDLQACVVTEAGMVHCGFPGVTKKVPNLSDATQTAVGRRHACALKKDGSVVCWGERHEGVLGDGVPDFFTSAVQVALP
ncbi:MAG: hypothetical protein IPK82_16510 [Polyangiaceae bacterium]|nr:hypothetical protein [Polyangiaceae bacterium]